MREIYKSGVTPQQKIVAINNKFGNNTIKDQQGTSRIIYDTIEATTGKTNFRFFEDSASRSFPLTNTGSEGNKLGVGDSMVVAQVLFTVISFENNVWSGNNNNLLNATGTLATAYINLQIANNQVIKKLTLTEADNSFNKDTSGINNTIDLETSIVIPPLLPFTLELQLPQELPTPAPGVTQFIQCQIIGVGGIIAPRTTF